jgi:hypothetical protein
VWEKQCTTDFGLRTVRNGPMGDGASWTSLGKVFLFRKKSKLLPSTIAKIWITP